VGQEQAEHERVAQAHDAGLAITTYFNPMICTSYEPTYDEAAAKGYLTKNALGQPYEYRYTGSSTFLVGPFDFSNPGAREFYGKLLGEAVGNGYDGWMEDFGEYVPPDSLLADGRTGLEAHNGYCTDYHRASHQLTHDRPAFAQFVRCGFTGTAPYARIVWGGDPTEDDSEADGLAAAVHQGLSMGLSGIAYWGSDIGGFHALFTDERTSAELLERWLQFGAFSGIMRTQAEGFGRPDQEGQHRAEVWDEDVLPHWRRLAQLRTRLAPYTVAAALEYRRTGMPIMRHLALAYPDAPEAWTTPFEFLFGPDLLVAPVVDMGATTRDVWLPPGQWVVLDDVLAGNGRSRIEGGRTITVDAPLDRIPVFVKAGACLPMLPADVDTLVTDTGFAHDDTVVTLADRADDIRDVCS
jgi:alpha-glucosidase (family GH31 glycosyl hydrolase)